jgi:hypothetical protein
LPGGSSITYGDDKLTVTSGGTEIVVEKDGDVSVKSAGNVKIESQGDISLEAGGNVNVKAQQNVSVQGLATTVEGQISVNGMTSFSPS